MGNNNEDKDYSDMLRKIALDGLNEVKNLTDNGKCSRCGECCDDFLPVTLKEVDDISKYIQRNGIKGISKVSLFPELIFDKQCPFLDNKKNECLIYAVRPEVCKEFICSQSKNEMADNQVKRITGDEYFMISMHVTFLKSKIVREIIEDDFVFSNTITFIDG